MFAIYWPVMAFVASIVVVLVLLIVSMSRLCRARLDPLPERDLATYLPEDDDAVLQYEYDQQQQQNQSGFDYSLEMDYPPSSYQ